MSDPAVEAARKVRDGHPYCLNDHHSDSCLTDAAREALKQIRELHRRTDAGVCAHCPDPADSRWGAQWPCDTAKLLYTTEELA